MVSQGTDFPGFGSGSTSGKTVEGMLYWCMIHALMHHLGPIAKLGLRYILSWQMSYVKTSDLRMASYRRRTEEVNGTINPIRTGVRWVGICSFLSIGMYCSCVR